MPTSAPRLIKGPKRIICMTEETTETLYLLGEQDRIVGISGYTVRPPEARRDKPKISAFTSAKIDKILDLKPDLVLGFSDMQADIAADLVRAGVNVHIFNHRRVSEIFDMIHMLGAMVGAAQKTDVLISELQSGLDDIAQKAAHFDKRPKVYFEEWNDPMIAGIGWVSDLIEIAGGIDCFPDLASSQGAMGRIIADPSEVVARAPDIIIGSWCGKKFRPEHVRARVGWSDIPAVRFDHIYEIKSPIILQPGPAALTDGVCALHDILASWVSAQ